VGTLSLTLLTICGGTALAKEFLEPTGALLSWEVIATGWRWAERVVFKEDIEALLERIL
jgi:hypothetical protein